MTTLNQPLTLEEYRLQVVEQIKASTNPVHALELLSDVETMLAATKITRSLQRVFWRDLSQDLDLLTQKAALLDAGPAATLRTVITAARGATVRALRRLTEADTPSSSGPPGDKP